MTLQDNITAIAAAVNAGKRPAVAVMEEYVARIEAYDAVQPQIWIARFAREDLLARAGEIDASVKVGEKLPLAGVPFAVKDNIDVAGLATTAACPAFTYRPEKDATVVSRLVAAGAIPVGKTNLDQFATGLTGSRTPYGACGCVFNRNYISGGSSSGSAVAVAAGLVPFALGTDTAGSGRVPAAFNGLFGFKPSRGRWSADGVVPACRSLDCVSVFSASASDAERVDSVLVAFDEHDIYSRALPADMRPAMCKLGIPLAGQINWCGDSQSLALFDNAKRRLAGMGAELVEVDIAPLLDCARLLYDGPWVAERAVAIGPLLGDPSGAIHPVVRAIIQGGVNMSATQVFKGLYALKRYERATARLWDRIDALLLPTAPTIYRIAEVLAEPFALNANLGLFTNFVNLLDMAAISAPAGFRDNGTGFGVSFIGPAGSDLRLVDLAGRFDAAQPSVRPPLDTEPRPQMVKLAVVGAHLSGMPLNWQLSSRGARLIRACRTAPTYRLYAMTDTSPPKPALIHAEGGAAIEVEVYELGLAEFGSFTAEVPAPLAIGSVVLETGETVKGFVGELRAISGAEDITHLGGWRAFVKARR